MKRYIILLLLMLAVYTLTGCSEGPREIPSEDIYDGELEISGHIVPRLITYDWLTSIGFAEVKSDKQACDACDSDILKFSKDGLGYDVYAYLPESMKNSNEEPLEFSCLRAVLKDGSKELATFSGGITLGKTSPEELKRIIPGLKEVKGKTETRFAFIGGPGRSAITFTFVGDVLTTIDVYPLTNPYEEGERADISVYESMDGEDVSMLVDTNVKDIVSHMLNRETFIFVAGFSKCPWCNRIMPYLNEVAQEKDFPVGYLDTRKDPSWESNLDIDDYKLFVEFFGEYLEEDENGSPHLYVPDIYFIKKGKVVMRFDGSIEGADDPNASLSEEQIEHLKSTLNKGFDLLD